LDDPEAGQAMRRRSMEWLDWLAQDTNLQVHSFTYSGLARVAAEHGDAGTVGQIIGDPKRLWLDKHARTRVSDPGFGQLDQLGSDQISSKLPYIAELMAVTPAENAEQMHATVMPVFKDIVTEFVGRDLTDKGYPIESAGRYLLEVGTPEALEQLDILVGAMPMTASRLDLLASLSKRHQRFAAATAEALTWYNDRAALAQTHLASYLKPLGTGRNFVDYPLTPHGDQDPVASQPIAAAIVDEIPNGGAATSAIETSAAYVSNTLGGTVHGDILKCVRIITSDPQFELTDPQFGFAATFEDGDHNRYAQGRVTVVDRSLPDGRLVIDLSDAPFWSSVAYDDTRFLCRIIQTEKDRRGETI
jgi:hypothetical protein